MKSSHNCEECWKSTEQKEFSPTFENVYIQQKTLNEDLCVPFTKKSIKQDKIIKANFMFHVNQQKEKQEKENLSR